MYTIISLLISFSNSNFTVFYTVILCHLTRLICAPAFYVCVLVAGVEHIVSVLGTTGRKLEDDWFVLLDVAPKKSGINNLND